MVQNSTKGLKGKATSGGRKNGGQMKKGARAIPPKKTEHVRKAVAQKKLSSSINNSIERQMVQAASAGKLTIMRNSGLTAEEVAKKEAKAKGRNKPAASK